MRWILVFLVIVLIVLQTRLWLGQGSWEQIVSLQREIEQQTLINERLTERNNVLEKKCVI